jgi:hypothetical protein
MTATPIKDMFSPKIGAPLRVITERQIEEERALWVSTRYNIAHRARVLKINPTTLAYHLRPVTGCRQRVGKRVQDLIDAADALREVAPKDGSAWKALQAYAVARSAITRRKA